MSGECRHCGSPFYSGETLTLIPLASFYVGEWHRGFTNGEDYLHLQCFLPYLKGNTWEEED